MSRRTERTGAPPEPVRPQPPEALRPPRPLRPGLRLNIRGRSVHLRGLRRPPTGLWRWLAILGPGVVAANAGNDAGAVATYSQAGASYGYELLWLLGLIAVALGVIQEIAGRLGAATGRGLLDLVRERFGIGWALLAVVVVLLANGGVIVTEFAGIGAAAELLGLSRYLVVPILAAALGYLVIAGSYARVEQIFLGLTLILFTYPVAAILSHPDWGAVLHGLTTPTPRADPDYLTVVVGLIGTGLTPYQQIFQQSTVVEKGVARRHYGTERLDTYSGALFAILIAAFVIIATATTIHTTGGGAIETAEAAAAALKPVAGDMAEALFAVGLLGASLIAAGALPLATAYAVSETFGFRKGVNLDFRRAPVFFGLFAALLVLGAGVALFPGIPLIPLLVGVQVLNGALLPVILLLLLLLVNDGRLCGHLKNNRLENIVGWGTLGLVTLAVAVLFGSHLLQGFGSGGG